MAIKDRQTTDWLEQLRQRAKQPLSGAERARRHAETCQILAERDRLPSIAPDTVADYIRQIRDESSGE